MLKNLCGCKTCVCTTGGYQVHITIENLNAKVSAFINENGGEIIKLKNYTNDSFYEENITSKNYNKYEDAYEEMYKWDEIIKSLGSSVTRLKIESHPKEASQSLYYEYHYKISRQETEQYKKLGCFISENSKGTIFATKRSKEPVNPIKPEHRLEKVCIDSNPGLDKRMMSK
jgi:hypothetical protein